MRALIVDDERLARARLRKLLEPHQEISVVGEASSVATAKKAIIELSPDLVFLDISMPGGSGFDLLSEQRIDGAVVFVTAFDEHALRAFDVGAADYLLKPIEPARLAQTIERLRARAPVKRDCLYLRQGALVEVVDVANILVLRASGDQSELHLRDRRILTQSEPLRHWEERLGSGFMRVHRSSLVSLADVERVERSTGASTSQLYLRGLEEAIPVSRSKLAALKEALQQFGSST